MYDSILLPTDGQPGTERATGHALGLARTFDASVHALSVVDADATPGMLPDDEKESLHDRLEEQGEAATVDVQNRAGDDVGVVRHVRDGRPYRAILEYADEHGVDLVVMGTRARDGSRAHLGSTTQRVLTRADVPVVAVPLGGPGSETDSGRYDRVVIPTDGSDPAERAAEHALAIAERYDADVRVVYVVDTDTYGYGDAPRSIVGLLEEGGRNAVEGIAGEARERGLAASTVVLRGIPEEKLLEYVDGAGADLVAMGTRGHRRDDRLLGSATARVVRRSSVPVLTVR